MQNFRANLSEIPSYDVTERDWRIKLNANESTLNLPPLVAERVMTRLSRVAFNRYPNDEADDLKSQIAQNFSVGKDQILLGNGSSEIIEKIFYAFGGNGHSIVFPIPSFSMYKIYAKAAEAEAVPFTLGNKFSLPREKFIETIKENGASLAVICNPNNPTGTLYPQKTIEYIAKNTDCPLLIDEAYIEFSPGETSIGLLKKYPNIMIARTFSKAYGLAAARVGYLTASPNLIGMLSRAFMPYHMNVLSLVTADIVYQMRDEFLGRISITISERDRIANELAKIKDLKIYPSSTNFILMKCKYASELNSYLENQGIGVRSFIGSTELLNSIRISVGTFEENEILMKEIKKFTEEKKS